MYWKDIGYILKEKNIKDELYRPKNVYEEIKVYCNIKSIGQSEFYQAQTAGFKPEIKVEIKLMDITPDMTHFRYNNTTYKILRSYKLQDKIELTLTSMVVPNE